MITKSARAYTRSELKDKLEEQLAAALNHHYLLSLLDLCGFTHYLLDHWTSQLPLPKGWGLRKPQVD